GRSHNHNRDQNQEDRKCGSHSQRFSRIRSNATQASSYKRATKFHGSNSTRLFLFVLVLDFVLFLDQRGRERWTSKIKILVIFASPIGPFNQFGHHPGNAAAIRPSLPMLARLRPRSLQRMPISKKARPFSRHKTAAIG